MSRVLSGVGSVKEATARRVMEAAGQLNYVPSALAQRFALRKSGNLGVILPMLPKVNLFSTYYFSEVLSGIGMTAKQRGYDLLLLFREPDEPRDYANLFRTQKVDGCIIIGAQDVPSERAALAELKDGNHPFCLVNQRYDGEAYNSVDADQRTGCRDAVRHLLEQGCRKIGFLNGPAVYSNSEDRLRGYREALEEAGFGVPAGTGPARQLQPHQRLPASESGCIARSGRAYRCGHRRERSDGDRPAAGVEGIGRRCRGRRGAHRLRRFRYRAHDGSAADFDPRAVLRYRQRGRVQAARCRGESRRFRRVRRQIARYAHSARFLFACRNDQCLKFVLRIVKLDLST